MHIYSVISLELVVKTTHSEASHRKNEPFRRFLVSNRCFSEIQATCPLSYTDAAQVFGKMPLAAETCKQYALSVVS